ncbi:23S rRNA pseudouridine(2604) synthase RluF [Mangrovibacterium lignilyticum]|uniref:23S rRNA pseudouridine(2604) synthase RluF n=1 Tax=Mangrovibacterium lignilyticum TaxID=2668052 RepID=UPI0013D75274|nr:23S rRNA pseudouridine(2604) synthase RluF [Mangrovibacterium lignilyticum]
MEDENSVRVNKYFSEIGYCSRREADKFIEQKRVTINGAIAEMGSKVSANDDVRLDGKPLAGKENKMVYLAFNKPRGIVCTTDTVREKNNIIDFINYSERIFPIGRLDKDSQGLILLTNDGDIVNKILRASNNHEKEYLVTVEQPITKSFIQKMGNGVPILGTVTKKCFVEQIDKFRFRIILTQGLNRQIRRMCEYLGNKVSQLERYRIMNINLDVPLGKWRHLTRKELKVIQTLVSDSSKTIENTPSATRAGREPRAKGKVSGKVSGQRAGRRRK